MHGLLRLAAPLRLLLPLALLLAACGSPAPPGVAPGPGRAVVALAASDGRVLWRKELEPPSAAADPVLVAGVAVVVSSGPMVAYDARTGERLWSLDDVGPFPPQVAGALLVLPADGLLRVLEPRTGRLRWSRPVGREVRVFAGPGGVVLVSDRTPSPPLDDPLEPQADGAPGGRVVLLGLDGRQRWSRELPGKPFSAHPGADSVVVGDLRVGVTALEPADGTLRWRTPSGPVEGVLDATTRVVARLERAVVALDPRTGREAWRRSRTASSGAAPSAHDGLLLVPALGAPTLVLALADGDVRADNDLGAGDSALSGDRLVAGDDRARVRSSPLGADGTPWRHAPGTGERPYLQLDADDDVVVAVVGWGQPETRDRRRGGQ